MAWATKYRCEFIDNGGLVWKWDFQWDGYSGDVIDMQGTDDPGMYEALSDSDDIFDNPIKGTQVKLKVYAEENLDYEDFFTVEDMEVKCLIYAGSDLFFSGYVQSRTYSEPYDSAPYWVEITAICGLALLKNHKYDDSGSTYYGHKFISEIIMDDILDKIACNKFHEIINIYDSDINSAVGDSPIDQILLNRIRFADMSCYEVLSYILMSFNAMIRQADGEFYIYRPLELRCGTSYCRTYTTSMLKSDSTIDVVKYIDRTGTATELHSHNGGVKMLLIPAKKIILHQDLGYKESWLKNYKFDSIYIDWVFGFVPTHWDLTNIYLPRIMPVGGYDPSSKDGIAIGPYNAYPTLSSYISQEIGDNAIIAAGDVMILEFEYQWFNFESSAKIPQFYFSVVAGSYSLDEIDGSYAEWVTPATNMSIQEIVDPGSSGWQTWKRIIPSLDVNGPITVTLYCLDNTDNISIGIKNIRFTVVRDNISIKKTYKRIYGNPRKRISSWRFDYQREYSDIAEVVQKDIEVTNSIKGDEIERDYIIGDVLDADVNIDNITEQFSGATVRALKQYRVDEITLTGTYGRARITVNNRNATAIWDTNLTTSAALFVTTYATLYDAANITLTSSGAKLIFTSQVLGMGYEGDSAVLNLEGDLGGTVAYTTAAKGSVLYPTTEWARRGVSEATGLLNIIAAEVAEQRSRVRQFLSLPVWDMYSGDTDPHISPIGIYIDPINYINPPGTLARQFAFLRGYYDMLNRHWDIDLIELVDNTVPDGDPSTLSATADGSDTINLTWVNGSTDEDGISIERSLDGVTWVEIDTVAAAETSYSDTSCEELTTYYYRVRAFKNTGYSDYSNTDSDTTVVISGTAPVFVSAVVENATPTKVTLTYDQALDETSTPATGDFTVTSETVSEVLVTGSTVVLTLSAAMTVFDAHSVTYTKGANTIRGSVGGLEADSLGATAITNNIAHDGNTVAWYLADDLTTVTKDGSNLVSKWADKLASGHDLLQATGTNQPLWVSPGTIRFDGIDNSMATTNFGYVQPEMIYLLFKLITWNATQGMIIDGLGYEELYVHTHTISPKISNYISGSGWGQDLDIDINTYGILRICSKGVGSFLKWNDNIPKDGSFGVRNMGGIKIAAYGALAAYHCSNIEVKEIICRKVVDDANTEESIYNYLVTRKP